MEEAEKIGNGISNSLLFFSWLLLLIKVTVAPNISLFWCLLPMYILASITLILLILVVLVVIMSIFN